jgi:hypothetical protein
MPSLDGGLGNHLTDSVSLRNSKLPDKYQNFQDWINRISLVVGTLVVALE